MLFQCTARSTAGDAPLGDRRALLGHNAKALVDLARKETPRVETPDCRAPQRDALARSHEYMLSCEMIPILFAQLSPRD